MISSRTVFYAVLLSLTIFPLAVAQAAPGRGTTYSCTVSVTNVGSPVTSFLVRTTITSTGGFLPTSETDFLQSYKGGLLYSSLRQDFTVPRKSTTATVTIVPIANGPGAYTFDSTVGVVKGDGSFSQLARCTGTAAI